MSGERQKRLKDYSAIVDAKLPAILRLVQDNSDALNTALEKLLSLEKKTRLAADAPSTLRLAEAILSVLYEGGEWDLLNEHITLLCKRRAQLQKVAQCVIKQAAGYVDDTPNKDSKVKLLETLRTVSEGKIYAELERARLTRKLAEIQEAEGNAAQAADTLQDVAVETIGSMDVAEKAEFLLEQLRLFLLKKDYVRAEIISNKVNTEVLSDAKLQDLKLKYYHLMVDFHMHAGNHLEVSRAWYAMFNTPDVQDDDEKWHESLKKATMFAVLAPWDHDTNEIVQLLLQQKRLKKLPECLALLRLFTTIELISWPHPALSSWEEYLPAFAVETDDVEPMNIVDDGDDDEEEDDEEEDDDGRRMNVDSDDDDDDEPIGGEDDDGSDLFKKDKWRLLHKRVVQHNIRVIAQYYTRIEVPRLAELLSLSQTRTERFVCELVSLKQLYAKIDRPAKQVSFRAKRNADDTLNDWAADLVELLKLVDNTCHQINKEKMMYKIK